ncbi:hypothetical protein MVEG_08164 [Podila verticillata NRRL 6337]|nr:hypothetical protein MVEG_08164 [Podila verticillata NRRL 6337]
MSPASKTHHRKAYAPNRPSSEPSVNQTTAELCLPFTPEELELLSKPRVLIAGGGLAGLTLAILLHKANIPFLVFERAKEIKPLGSAIVLGTGVCPIFQQLDIWDEFTRISKYYLQMGIYDENLKHAYDMDIDWLKRIVQSREYVVSRPELYNLLLSQIPKDRIHLGKRILSFKQDNDSVLIQCSDNSNYVGDILVGADGAYSAVRQHLYKTLRMSGDLPKSDDVPLPFSCVCLVGQTGVLDPEEFPALQAETCQFNTIMGTDNMCTWTTFTTKQNTVCWMVIQFLTKETSKENDSFRNSQWGPEAAEAMAKEVRDFKVPGGREGHILTLGDYLDKTPKNLVSKVMLEEIVFDTWYGCRTVLIGDACHKMNPTGGVGALMAMHDAVALANWISTLRLPTVPQLEHVFKEYRAERYPVAKEAFERSQLFTKNLGKNMLSLVVRACMKRLPAWLWRKLVIKNIIASRPQASFLPLVHDSAKVKPLPQPSLHKTLAINKGLATNSKIHGMLQSTNNLAVV